MGKCHWPYRVQLASPFVKANSEEIMRWLAVEPLPRRHALRGPEETSCASASQRRAMQQFSIGGSTVNGSIRSNKMKRRLHEQSRSTGLRTTTNLLSRVRYSIILPGAIFKGCLR